jgi:hypothetical protein
MLVGNSTIPHFKDLEIWGSGESDKTVCGNQRVVQVYLSKLAQLTQGTQAHIRNRGTANHEGVQIRQRRELRNPSI